MFFEKKCHFQHLLSDFCNLRECFFRNDIVRLYLFGWRAARYFITHAASKIYSGSIEYEFVLGEIWFFPIFFGRRNWKKKIWNKKKKKKNINNFQKSMREGTRHYFFFMRPYHCFAKVFHFDVNKQESKGGMRDKVQRCHISQILTSPDSLVQVVSHLIRNSHYTTVCHQYWRSSESGLVNFLKVVLYFQQQQKFYESNFNLITLAIGLQNP